MAYPRVRLRFATIVTVVVTIVLGASACSGSDDSGSSSSKSSDDSVALVGVNWVLTDQASLGVPLTAVTVTARFQDGSISGDSGCNAYRASYTTNGTEMTVGSDIATTLRLCVSGGDVEQAYLARLPRVASYRIAGTRLSLLGRDGDAILVYRASDGARELLGTWNLTGYYTGTAIQSVISGTTLTAEFAQQVVSGEGGCNLFNGPYETTGDSISIGPLASTLRACADPAVGAQETQYLAALELAKTFRVTGNQLELLRADGGFAATFARAP
jgi:heat shock protein HslJ